MATSKIKVDYGVIEKQLRFDYYAENILRTEEFTPPAGCDIYHSFIELIPYTTLGLKVGSVRYTHSSDGDRVLLIAASGKSFSSTDTITLRAFFIPTSKIISA